MNLYRGVLYACTAVAIVAGLVWLAGDVAATLIYRRWMSYPSR